jgi:hypothetical protein
MASASSSTWLGALAGDVELLAEIGHHIMARVLAG